MNAGNDACALLIDNWIAFEMWACTASLMAEWEKSQRHGNVNCWRRTRLPQSSAANVIRPLCSILRCECVKRVIRESPIWSKTLMELIFNAYCEFRWNPEGPVSQIHSPHLHVVPLGSFQIFQGLFRCLWESGLRKATGIYLTYPSLLKIAAWVP